MRATNKRFKRYASRKRNIPYPGKPIEAYQHNKLGKCWYCEHVNTVGREEQDSGDSSMSATYTFNIRVSRGAIDGAKGVMSVPRSPFMYRVAPKAGHDGNPKAVKNMIKVTHHRGCSACGTLTWGG